MSPCSRKKVYGGEPTGKRYAGAGKRHTKEPIGGSMDMVYVGTGLLFFALCWGLLRLCERL